MADTLYSAAVKNPILQQAATNAMFESVGMGDSRSTSNQPASTNTATYSFMNAKVAQHQDPNLLILDITEQELEKLKRWNKIVRVAMLILATLMMITAYYNFATASNSVSSNFLALYILFFSVLICCYEIAWKTVSAAIAQNFGFMYRPIGRTIFYILVAIILFQLSTIGQIIFAFLIVLIIFQAILSCRHPQFDAYVRATHFHKRIETKAAYEARQNNNESITSWIKNIL